MADDAEKTEKSIIFYKKGTCPFFYADRYGTKEKSILDFYEFF
ncbi:hypothetical protein [Sulfurimonas sp.]